MQCLDISPVPALLAAPARRKPLMKFSTARPPKAFNLQDVLKRMANYTAKLPNLRIVRYEFPNVQEDRFVIHLRSGQITGIDLTTHMLVNLHARPMEPSEAPKYPATPSFPDIDVKHSIYITLHEPRVDEYDNDLDRAARAAHVQSWKKYFYLDELDPRVCAVNHVDVQDSQRIHLDVDESISFLNRRTESSCVPVTSFAIDAEDGVPPSSFRSLAAALGPHLRVLRLHTSLFGSLDSDQTGISIIDTSLPLLAEFYISFDHSFEITKSHAEPLVGLLGLRKLSFDGLTGQIKTVIARYLCQLGGHRCIYYDVVDEIETKRSTFHGLVKDEQKLLVRFSLLHDI